MSDLPDLNFDPRPLSGARVHVPEEFGWSLETAKSFGRQVIEQAILAARELTYQHRKVFVLGLHEEHMVPAVPDAPVASLIVRYPLKAAMWFADVVVLTMNDGSVKVLKSRGDDYLEQTSFAYLLTES